MPEPHRLSLLLALLVTLLVTTLVTTLAVGCMRPSQQIIDTAYLRNSLRRGPKVPTESRAVGRDPHTGERSEDRSYLNMPDGRRLRHGQHRTWYPEGTPETLRTYDEGAPVGTWWTWWRTGALRSAYVFEPGTETRMTWWHANGIVSSEGLARNGTRTGPWQFWYENGELKSEGDFVGGRRGGDWVLYDTDGEWTERGRFRGGKRVGEWEFRSRPTR